MFIRIIVYNIRKEIFEKNEYEKLFGTSPNSPLNKGLLKDSYLPTFNALFYRFIIFIQFALFVSFILIQESSQPILDFVRNHRFTYGYILSFALLINLSEYVRFFIKYKSKVDTIKRYKGENINPLLSLVQEGWATLIPIILLLELAINGVWKKVCIIAVEIGAWSLLVFFIIYLFKILLIESKKGYSNP